MSRLTTTRVVDGADVAAFLRPRDDVVAERADGDGRFVAVGGPFSAYERRVRVEPERDGRATVTQEIEFKLAVPLWWVVFVIPYRLALAHPPRPGHQPWWAPPDRLDARAATVLGLLCSISIVGGYLGTLITQTLTFAAEEFDASDASQGRVFAAARVGVFIALAAAAAADRRGRRNLLALSAAAACLFTATGAVAPNLLALGLSQTVARGFSSALVVLIGIVSAEEMPKGSRAYAFSLTTMVGALGAGMCLWALPLADLGETAWRILYVIPLAGLPVVAAVYRRLPESRRFGAAHVEAPMAGHGRRFWLLAASGFLLAIFAAPASQFQNEFLRDERGFSAAGISLFVLATSTPAGLAIVIGGRVADVRGRRAVGAIGIVGGTLLSVAFFASSGSAMWAAALAGTMIAALTVPALGVYRPELFPTSLRGRASGTIEVLTVAGSAAGLLIVGELSSRWGGFTRPIALLAAAPLTVAVLVLTLYPETAKRELEDLNPEDRLAPATADQSPEAGEPD